MKKGFTLVELLAVIIILGIIVLITFASVDSILKNSKESLSATQQKNVEDAAEAYYLKEGMSYNDDCISISQLIKKGYIESSEVKNPKTKEAMNGYVKITHEANQYSYKYQEKSCTSKIYTVVTETTTGIIPQVDNNGNIVPGSEFKIKVNNSYEPMTFFVLSNNGEYVNLIAEQNITIEGKFTSEPQSSDEWYVTSSDSYNNTYGPQAAYTYLNEATSNWTNIPLIKNFTYIDEGNQINPSVGYKGITTRLDEESGDYITTIIPLTSDAVEYKNMRARLPYVEEIIKNTTCEIYSDTSNQGTCPIWMVNYLSKSSYYPTTQKINSTGTNNGYFTLSSYPSNTNNARILNLHGALNYTLTNYAERGIRPVITILKSELLSEMN